MLFEKNVFLSDIVFFLEEIKEAFVWQCYHAEACRQLETLFYTQQNAVRDCLKSLS